MAAERRQRGGFVDEKAEQTMVSSNRLSSPQIKYVMRPSSKFFATANVLSEMQSEAEAIRAGLKRPIGGGLVGAMEIIDVCTAVHPSIAHSQTGDA